MLEIARGTHDMFYMVNIFRSTRRSLCLYMIVQKRLLVTSYPFTEGVQGKIWILACTRVSHNIWAITWMQHMLMQYIFYISCLAFTWLLAVFFFLYVYKHSQWTDPFYEIKQPFSITPHTLTTCVPNTTKADVFFLFIVAQRARKYRRMQ